MPDPSTLFRALPSMDKSLDALARALDGRQDEDAKAILDAPHALLREAVSAYWDNMRLRVRKGLVPDPAYFHELPAGDDSLPALAEGVHDKEHCRSVVVDNKGVLGTGQGAQKMCQKAVSAAAATCLRIELKICVV